MHMPTIITLIYNSSSKKPLPPGYVAMQSTLWFPQEHPKESTYRYEIQRSKKKNKVTMEVLPIVDAKEKPRQLIMRSPASSG